MKKLVYNFVLIFVFIFTSCEEEPIVIPPLGGNSNVGNNNVGIVKKVLIEEYTGAGCVNCPDGAAALNDLKGIYKDNLILVSIHAGFFTKKSQLPKEAKLDFTTPKGNELQLFLGEPTGYPSAVINRKKREADGSLVAGSKDQWAGIVQAESKETSDVKITFKNGYDPTNRKWQINFQFEPQKDLTENYAYTVMVVEDKIIDAQKTPTGVKVNYEHRHVLRDILTAAQGDAITEKMTKGNTIGRSLNYSVPANFNDKNCEIIVVLHKTGGSKEIIQAEFDKMK